MSLIRGIVFIFFYVISYFLTVKVTSKEIFWYNGIWTQDQWVKTTCSTNAPYRNRVINRTLLIYFFFNVHVSAYMPKIIKELCLGAVYSETCVKHTSVTFHYNVCSKMMASTWSKWHAACFKCMPSFYYIHCSETWHLCVSHTFHCRRPLKTKGQNKTISGYVGMKNFRKTSKVRCHPL